MVHYRQQVPVLISVRRLVSVEVTNQQCKISLK